MVEKIKSYSCGQGKRKEKAPMRIGEKLDLIEEYIAQYGIESINGKTIYKGVPIGEIIIRMRYFVNSGRFKYNKEIISRMEADGILEKVKEGTAPKVERLENYCENNMGIWRLRKKIIGDCLDTTYGEFIKNGVKDKCNEMREFLRTHQIHLNDDSDETILKIIEELRVAVIDYQALSVKISHGLMKREFIERLKKAGVGGPFVDKDEIGELSQKTGIEIERLNQIICDFGTIDEFRKIYIAFMVTWNELDDKELRGPNRFQASNDYIVKTFGSIKKFENFRTHFKYLAKRNKIVTFFDLTEGGFVPADEARSLAYILGLEKSLGLFFDGEACQKASRKLTKKQKIMIEGMIKRDPNETLYEVADSFNITKTRLLQVRECVSKTVLNQEKPKVWDAKISGKARQKFITKYFEHKDIFISEDSYTLSNELKQELKRILVYDVVQNGNSSLDTSRLDNELKELISMLQFAYKERNLEKETMEKGEKKEDDREYR